MQTVAEHHTVREPVPTPADSGPAWIRDLMAAPAAPQLVSDGVQVAMRQGQACRLLELQALQRWHLGAAAMLQEGSPSRYAAHSSLCEARTDQAITDDAKSNHIVLQLYLEPPGGPTCSHCDLKPAQGR